jgi:hypothetical protein
MALAKIPIYSDPAYRTPLKTEVDLFRTTFHSIPQETLSRIAYSRLVQLTALHQLVTTHDLTNQAHVGVISGGGSEPELALFKIDKTTICAYEENIKYDLDKSWLEWPSYEFSFTICNYTFEHIFNPFVAIKNLIHHTASGGYLFLSMPVVDCIHGEPHFYYSGFHPRFLSRIAQEYGLEIIALGAWGNHKAMINGMHGRWLNESESHRGFFNFTQLRHPIDALRALARNFRQLSVIFEDGRIQSSTYLTNTWILLRKPF